eukprot:COSAG02_NODE_16781_length_1056_cov_1.273772_1_plen_46_part_10
MTEPVSVRIHRSTRAGKKFVAIRVPHSYLALADATSPLIVTVRWEA